MEEAQAKLDEEFDKVLALIPMAKEQEPLEEIATTLDLDITAEREAANKRAIQRKILNHLNSTAFDEVVDRERLILSALETMNTHLGFQPKLEESEEEDSESDDDSKADAKLVHGVKNNAGVKLQAGVPEKGQVTVVSGMRLKDFKFDGSVGHPGEKGKLDYAGVMHNINMGKQRGFDETEICSAAVHAITPGNPTRTYLEGREKLTLAKVISSFKAHFIHRNITDIYNEMIHACQGSGPKDTAMSFILSMFSLRDQIIQQCKDKKPGEQKYSPKLVQSEMQKSIYAGLTDDNIRQDLKQVLKIKNLDDDELLEEVREAMISKEERDKKLEEANKKKASVSSIKSKTDKSRSQSKQGSDTKKTDNKANPPTQNMDSFMVQLSSVIGSQMRDIVEPLQNQIDDLTTFKNKHEAQKNKQTQQLNVKAPSFHSNQPKLGPGVGGKDGIVGRPGGGNVVASGANFVDGGGSVGSGFLPGNGPGSDEFLAKLYHQLSIYNESNSKRSGNNFNVNNNKTKWSGKCSICRNAGALSCNHCLICHKVDHRTGNCPHRNDPNFVPKN